MQVELTALNPASFHSSCSRLISSFDSVFSTFMDGSALSVLVDVAIFEGGREQSPSSPTTASLPSMSTGMSGSSFSLSRAKDIRNILLRDPIQLCGGNCGRSGFEVKHRRVYIHDCEPTDACGIPVWTPCQSVDGTARPLCPPSKPVCWSVCHVQLISTRPDRATRR